MKAILSNTTHGVYHAMVNEIKKSLNEQKMVTVIVPDYFSMSVQRALLESLDKECTFHLEVEPFKNLAKRALGDKLKRCLTQEGSVMLMADVIDKNKDLMEYYKQAAGRNGFSEEFADAINTLRVSGISIESLFNAEEELPETTAKKLHHLAIVYKKYLESLSNRYNDKSTVLEKYAVELMGQQKDYNHDYFIMDFYYFSATQYAIIRGLENAGGQVVIGLVSDFNGKNLNGKIYPAKTILDKLEVLGLDITRARYIEQLSPAKEAVSNYLFSLVPLKDRVDNNGAFAFFKASTVYDEILRVALDIKYKVMKDKRRYQDFEIVCAQPNEYYNTLISIFKRLNISFYIDQKTKLVDQTIIRYLLAMFNVVTGGYKRADVFDLVKNPLFVNMYSNYKDQIEEKVQDDDELQDEGDNAEENVKYLDDIYQFENYTLKYNVNYTLFKKPFDLADEDDKEILAKAESIRTYMCDLLNQLEQFGNNEVVTDSIVNAIRDICIKVDYAWRAHMKKIGGVSKYYEKCSQQVNKKLDMILNEISIIMNGSMKTLSAFLDMFKTMIENVPIASVPVYRDSVFVGDTRSRFVGIGKIYILGAAQGSFPGVERNGIIISDRDEFNMEQAGLLISPSTQEKNYIQELSALEILKKSNETIDISYSTSVVGGHIKPSVVFQQINGLLFEYDKEKNKGPIPIQDIDLEDIEHMDKEEQKKIFETLFSMPKSRYYSVLKTLIPHRVTGEDNQKIYGTIYDLLDDVDKKKIQSLFAEQDYVEDGTLLLGEKKDNGTYESSVSKLEQFFRCPYAYFLKYGLCLKERDDAQMQKYETGSIIHEVLELFVRDYYMKDKVKASNIKDIANKCFDATIDDMPRYKNMAANEKKGLFQKLRIECEELCINVYNSIENSNFKPAYIEQKFDRYQNQFKPISLDIDGKKINITGKIDRVDKCGDNIFIVDYKTSKKDIELKELYYGVQIQLFMYLRSIEQNTNYNPIGAFYLPIYAQYDKNENKNARFKYTGVVLNDPDLKLYTDIDNNFSLETSKESMVPYKQDRSGQPSKEVVLEKPYLEAFEKYAELIAQKGLETISRGFVKATPLEYGCNKCGYSDVCKYRNTNSRRLSKPSTLVDDLAAITNTSVEQGGGQENG